MIMKSSLVRIDLQLDSQIIHTVPKVVISVDDEVVSDVPVSQAQTFLIERELPIGKHKVEIYFHNKNYRESGYNKEMAVLVKHIKFQHVDKDLHHLSKYVPEYPESFIVEQRKQGNEWPESLISNHLGWNGKYIVEFETPIYKWLHKKLHLGWLL